ncbi:hypothetical protein EPA93_44820 [Ktedonosporobacter rubrisoli]|uniref:Uncharacterized protein n=1 Tax=Ktedonosporobacter rubrisoli TaxID=2509675 RepID=A0A4P6K5A3_KTERU|nr:hypothetical protein [Ktedonosporobacter rubrisoli]QBD82716.1 hypothetical protein EPA93_44820 [Ktedonosporobacter rubrisoli]
MLCDRLRYELRLLGKQVFLTPLLVVIGFALLLALVNHDVDKVAQSMGASLEVLLPMTAGVVVATIAIYDRALELQLTMLYAYYSTATMRFLFILLWNALVSLLTSYLLYVFHLWRLPVQIAQWSQPWQFLTWQLSWLSSTLWLVALGLVLSQLLRSRSASGALICVLSIAELTFHHMMDQDPLYHPVYLFPLTYSPEASYWLTNRFELLITAAALLMLAWFLLRIPERLLSHAPGEE